MDINDIRNINLKGKSKEEIVSFLTTILTEFNLRIGYDELKEILTPTQISEIDEALEQDTRKDIKENAPDITDENEILNEIEIARNGRNYTFVKGEDGNIMIVDRDAVMQENPEVSGIDVEEFGVENLVNLLKNSIYYKQTHPNYFEGNEFINEYSEVIRQLEEFERKTWMIGFLKGHAENGFFKGRFYLDLVHETQSLINVNEIEALAGKDVAEIVRMARTAKADSMYQPDEFFNEDKIKMLKDEYINRGAYQIRDKENGMGYELFSGSSPVPFVDIDYSKMNEPEFNQALRSALERDTEIGRHLGEYAREELKEVVRLTLEHKEERGISSQEISDAAKDFAKETSVMEEEKSARDALDKLNGREDIVNEQGGYRE